MRWIKKAVFPSLCAILAASFVANFAFGTPLSGLEFLSSRRFYAVAAFLLIFALISLRRVKLNKVHIGFLVLALAVFALNVFDTTFLQLRGIDLDFIVSSWQVQIALVSFFAALLSAGLVEPKSFSKWDAKPTWRAASAIFALGFVSYVLLSFARHDGFGTHARDLGLFDQAIWNLSQFKAPESTIRGFANLWADHWHPLLALFAPLFWVWDNVKIILAAQAAIISLGVFPVYFLAFRFTKSNLFSAALSICYVFYGGFQHAVGFGFYPETCAPTLILFAFYFLFSGKRWLYFLFFFLSVAAKENIALYYLIPSVLVFIFFKDKRREAVATFVLAVSYFALTMKVIIPHFYGPGDYQYANMYEHLGSSLGDIFVNFASNPLHYLAMLFNPIEKLNTLLRVLGSFGFIPLGGIWIAMALPNLAENFLSSRQMQWGFGFYWQAGLAAAMVLSSIMAVSKLKKKTAPGSTLMLVISSYLVFSVLISNKVYATPLYKLFKEREFLIDRELFRSRATALSIIPEDASVSAQDNIAPHLSHRKTIYHYPQVEDSRFVVLSPTLSSFPFSKEEIKEEIRKYRESEEWLEVGGSDDIIIFERTS